jgi:hypothetical protein
MKKFGEFLTEKKWIQKAIDPEHKGYCTPMTKKTCTPHRKALAKRFKKHEFEHNEQYLSEEEKEKHNYMFFGNLKAIQHKINEILEMNQSDVDKRISDGHDWANDHVAVAKDNIQQVHNWLTARNED